MSGIIWKTQNKLVEAPIFRFPNWTNKLHVHVDASAIKVDVILTQPCDDHMDHPITYASEKLNKEEINYYTTEREGLRMIKISLQKFHHYLLENPFIYYIDHQ